MEALQVLYFAKMAVVLSMDLSMPTIIVASAVGLLVSVIQTVMQLQDQTVGFAVKLFATVLVLLATGPWFGGKIVMFMNLVIDGFPEITR